MYDSKAERQKAYYERKKEKMKKLEEESKDLEIQKRVLQEKLSKSLDELSINDITSFDWSKFTPSEMTLLNTRELESYISVLQDRIKSVFSYENLVENLVNIANAKKNIANLQESMQLQTLLYLLEAELASRERLLDRDAKLSALKDEIKELEAAELMEKPKIKTKK
jgi:hypothetical protein